jgi:cell division septation protein DedD
MLNIGQYLHKLLLVHQTVGVPGIGIFKSERIPAHFDEVKGAFLPPSNSYSFIQHEPVDQYLLDYISKALDLDLEDANEALEKATASLLAEISDKGEVKIDKIGYLKEQEGSYVLIPFSPDSFWGLQPVKELNSALATGETAVNTDELPDKELSTQEPLINPVPEAQQTEEGKSDKSKIWGWSIAALVLIVASLFWWYTKMQSRTTVQSPPVVQNDTKEAIPSTVTDTSSFQKDTVKKVVDTITTKKKPLIQKASKALPYSIVLGSFKTIDLAVKQAEYFRTIGIDAFVLESNMPHNRKKICYGLYATKEEAKKQLEKVRKEINPEAYIYP